MNRREFIKACAIGSVVVPALGGTLASCGGIHYAQSTLSNNIISIDEKEFIELRKNKTVFRKYVLIQDSSLGYPICLTRSMDAKYIATLLKCTHRACELAVGGGIYSCPCHGSEFTMEGEVLEGPATEHLQNFRISHDENKINIHLA